MTVHRRPTANLSPLSHVNNPGSPYSKSRDIAYKRGPQEFQTNLEIICTETRTLTKRVLSTVCEIHHTLRDRLNLVPNFSLPKHILLGEFELQHQKHFDGGPEASPRSDAGYERPLGQGGKR